MFVVFFTLGYSHEGMSAGSDGNGVGAGIQNVGGKNTPPHGSPTPMDKATLKVHLPNGGMNVVKFGDAMDVRGIISLLTSRLAAGTRHYRNLYAMRLHHPGSGESYWLHQDTTMYQVNISSVFIVLKICVIFFVFITIKLIF